MPTKGLKKQLNALSKEELIKHIIELDKKYKEVQEYHLVVFNNDIDTILQKLKTQIENEFYPKRGLPKERLSVARKAITEAKKLGLPPEILADLMLFYVETGVSYTSDFGDMNEAFYTSMENMFSTALDFMYNEALLEPFQKRARAIVDNSADTGWGFHDTLGDLYFEYFSDEQS